MTINIHPEGNMNLSISTGIYILYLPALNSFPGPLMDVSNPTTHPFILIENHPEMDVFVSR